jgi:hypothetical protein
MKNRNYLLAVGQLSFAIGIILNHFFRENDFIAFLGGLLIGLSIVSNIVFLVRYRKDNHSI